MRVSVLLELILELVSMVGAKSGIRVEGKDTFLYTDVPCLGGTQKFAHATGLLSHRAGTFRAVFEMSIIVAGFASSPICQPSACVISSIATLMGDPTLHNSFGTSLKAALLWWLFIAMALTYLKNPRAASVYTDLMSRLHGCRRTDARAVGTDQCSK